MIAGTQTSIRKEITTKPDGTKVIKTIVTETKIGPDGKKTTTTRETVTEGSDDEEVEHFLFTTNMAALPVYSKCIKITLNILKSIL